MTDVLGTVRFAVLTKFATTHGGLVSMLDAGWTRLDVVELPVTSMVWLVGQCLGVPDDGMIETVVLDPFGEELAKATILVVHPPGRLVQPLTTMLDTPMPVSIEHEGQYTVRISGSVETHELHFWVGLHR